MCIGTIGGICCITSILPFFIVSIFCVILTIEFVKSSKYRHYIKVFLKREIVLTFLFGCLLSTTRIAYLERQYSYFYKRKKEMTCYATIISNPKEDTYSYEYQVQLDTKQKLLLKVSKREKNDLLEYGDYIYLQGDYSKPSIQRNYKGFDYSLYLKSRGIYGTILTESWQIKVIKKDSIRRYF